MDYTLPEKLNLWYYFPIIILLLIIIFFQIKSINIMNINFTFLTFFVGVLATIINVIAVITAFGIYKASVIKEKEINNKLKELLINELFNNSLTINDNLQKIKEFRKTKKDVYGFGYISNNIFYSLIRSNRIVNVIDIFSLLMSFYNNDQSIRMVMNNVNQRINYNPLIPISAFEEMLSVSDDKGSLVENKFIEMKDILRKIFKAWGKEKEYIKLQHLGRKEYLQSQIHKEKSENQDSGHQTL